MLKYASEGKKVLRLKGGDPFIFEIRLKISITMLESDFTIFEVLTTINLQFNFPIL